MVIINIEHNSNTIYDEYVNEIPGHYFHPVDTQAIVGDDGTITGFTQSGCQEYLLDMKNSDIRRIRQCNIVLDRRNEARHAILGSVFRAFNKG